QVPARLGAHLLQDGERDGLVSVLLRKLVGAAHIEGRVEAVARPYGEPAARADDTGNRGPDGANGARRSEELGRQGGAVLDAARLEPRLEGRNFGPGRVG